MVRPQSAVHTAVDAAADASACSVAAVVVTWQRRELLELAVTALLSQTRRPDVIVVVDNASADGTAQMVAERFPNVDLLALSCNTGGAGGFTAGLHRALEDHGADLVWLMDDDTIARPDALEQLLRAREHCLRTPAAVASRVVWTDGRDHPMNTPRQAPFASVADRQAARDVGCLPVRSASFVSLLVDGAVVRQAGLPIADFFLWNDDFEFTARLLRGRLGLWCPASVVEHHTRYFGSTDADPGERFYYEVRNKIWTFTRSDGLSGRERVVYGASTALRWARTVRASTDRSTLLRAAGRGARDGLRTRPRNNEEVLTPALLEGGR